MYSSGRTGITVPLPVPVALSRVLFRQRGNYYLTGLQSGHARHCIEMVGLRSPVFSQLQYVKFGPATGPGPRVEVCINVTADLHDRSSVILLILHSVLAFS